jgi:hypothetical protein
MQSLYANQKEWIFSEDFGYTEREKKISDVLLFAADNTPSRLSRVGLQDD